MVDLPIQSGEFFIVMVCLPKGLPKPPNNLVVQIYMYCLHVSIQKDAY